MVLGGGISSIGYEIKTRRARAIVMRVTTTDNLRGLHDGLRIRHKGEDYAK